MGLRYLYPYPCVAYVECCVKTRKMLRLAMARTILGAVKTLEGAQTAPGRINGYSGHNACKYSLMEGTRNLHTTVKLDKEQIGRIGLKLRLPEMKGHMENTLRTSMHP